MFERKPPNGNQQILPHYIGEYERRQNNIDFESAKEISTEADKKMIVKKRFECMYNARESMDYTKNENFPEKKEVCIYGFKHIRTNKVTNYITIGCKLVELYENDKLVKVWSNKFINKEMEMKKFTITDLSF